MTTEYIGEAFRPIFNAAMAAWWAGNCEGVCPMENWEILPMFETTWIWGARNGQAVPSYCTSRKFRFKPAPKRTVTIGYRDLDGGNEHWKTLVAPEAEAPPLNTKYYCPGETKSYGAIWGGDSLDFSALAFGLVFLTREDAQAMSDWTAKCRGGGA